MRTDLSTTPDMAAARAKLGVLRAKVRDLHSAAIAFSGGVDSTLLARVAFEELGDQAVAVTARSATYPASEFQEAVALAAEIGIRHMTIDTQELEIDGFAENPPDRCYHCKSELFGRLRELAAQLGLRNVADGANADDTQDFRPGLRAAFELGVRSPIREAGLDKADVRSVSRLLGLRTWDKPAYACLSSRFPYGERISHDKVTRVDRAEEALKEMGFRGFRVRCHGAIARIEVATRDIARAASESVRKELVSRLKALGFGYVALDLEGYRTGSMNETLTPDQRAIAAGSPGNTQS